MMIYEAVQDGSGASYGARIPGVPDAAIVLGTVWVEWPIA